MKIQNRNMSNTPPPQFGTAPQRLSRRTIHALNQYKDGDFASKLNAKLRGLLDEPFTKDELIVLEELPKAPKKVLKQNTYVYRGVCCSPTFNPQEVFIPGTTYIEKGILSLSPQFSTAVAFRHRKGAILHILMPKGSEFIDIDDILKTHHYILPKNDAIRSRRERKHELLALQGAMLDTVEFTKRESYEPYRDLKGKFFLRLLGIGECLMEYKGQTII